MAHLQFKLTAPIHCRDGRVGNLHRVVIDPSTHRVVDLVVERGFLRKQDRVIPVSVVEGATLDDIYLTIDSEQLSEHPAYREVDYELPASGWQLNTGSRREQMYVWYSYSGISTEYAAVPKIHYHIPVGIPSDLLQIGPATPVRDEHGIVGRLDHLLVDQESWEISHFIVHKGLLPHELIIPVAWVKSMSDEGIFIEGHKELA
jgi:uncharacterized protein YrrD